MAKEKKNIKQPELEEQQMLNSILEATPTKVVVRGSTWKAKYLKPGTLRKMTNILLTEVQEDVVSVKCAAVFRLNNFFLIFFFYWILWRWMFYVKEYTNAELLPYISECKKKVGLEAYIYTTILLTGMKDSAMAMTREEVQRIQVEQLMVARGVSPKSTADLPNQNTTSVD